MITIQEMIENSHLSKEQKFEELKKKVNNIFVSNSGTTDTQ
jgi:hypothetical protein